MKLFPSKIPTIAHDMIHALAEANEIEVENVSEAELDVQAILKEYVRVDRELTDKAKDLAEQRGMSGSHMKIKAKLAEEKEFGLGEDATSWICTQIMETFMHSPHIAEVYADDAALRRRMRGVLQKHMSVDEELDAEVRQRIKNLQEGTSTWDTEYAKVMDQIKRKHGLDEK
jgi:hypothetical protein